MAWKAIDRQAPAFDSESAPEISGALRAKIEGLFGRYETKRAVLLPALAMAQDTLGHISHRTMVEIGEILEMPPSHVIDTLSFYTYYWTHPQGEKVVVACRSLSCELMGGKAVLAECKKHLGIGEHETTPNGEYSLVTEECLAGCDHAPCLLVNEKLHRCVKPEDVAGILADKENDHIAFARSDRFDGPPEADGEAVGDAARPEEPVLEATSDVAEMREAD